MHQLLRRTAHDRGYILVLGLVFLGIFFTISTAYVSSITTSVRSSHYDVASAQALAIAEGALDSAAAQFNQDPSYAGETNTALGNGVFTITVTNIDTNTKRITATGYVPNSMSPIATKTIKANIGLANSTISFHYGIQSGQGGFQMLNNSTIHGNVFSEGTVVGTGSSNIYGDVVSSGAGGFVYGIHSTGSILAHTIGKVGVATGADKDAYYTTKVNTTVTGTSYPGSADPVDAPLPISDAQIADWETQAAAGGTAVCSGGVYSISSGSVSLGPKKIPCNLSISGNSVVTITGHIWATGNITVQNNAVVKMAPVLGAANVALIADNPTDQINSSVWNVQNNAAFQNSGTVGSFVFLISQNRSAESGGAVTAINLQNNANSLVAYAAHGLVPLSNNVALKEVTAYKIVLQNNAVVTYDTGLPSSVFDSGPGGSWSFIPGTYAITQ